MSDWEDDFPTAKGGATGRGDNGSKACFKCGEEGHFSRECPTANNDGGGDRRTCRKCYKEGHIAGDCPFGGGGCGSWCRECSEVGHFARDCTKPLADGKELPPIYIPEDLDDSKLFDFSISPGINFDCHDNIPVKVIPFGQMKRAAEGLLYRTETAGPATVVKMQEMRGEEGHFSRDCTTLSADGNERPPYIPEDTDDSKLFNFSISSGFNFDCHDNIPVKVTAYVCVLDKIEKKVGVGLGDILLSNIAKAGYKRPTPIQKTALPILVEGCKKRQTLVNHINEILEMFEDEKILIFVERMKIADFLASFLCSFEKLRATSIHGDRYQSQREEALATFRSGLYNILVAVAMRGLDIRGISYVINYDMPKEIDENVHRIGRTGRVGHLDRAISFYDVTTDSPIAKDLVKILSDAGQVVGDWLMTAAQQSGYAQNYTAAGAFASADIRKGDTESVLASFRQEWKRELKSSSRKKLPPIYVPKELDDSKLFDFDSHDNIPVKVTAYVPDKIETFLGVGLRDILLSNIAKAGYERPTPIQKTALPILMAGHDVMGCAQTGSGKTAAFLIPILQFIIENNCESHGFEETAHPTAVIMAPTRELARQIHQEAKKFSVGSVVKSHLLYGGTSTSHQAQCLQTGCHILVATPGRLLQFVEKGKVKFDSLHWLVLDEADRMLDMGFRADMEKMINHPSMPDKGERKTLMFSATFSEELQELAFRYLHNYVYIEVGMVGAANTDVHQTVIEVEGCKKRQTLVNLINEILEMSEDEKILIIVERKKIADILASVLCSNEMLRVISIHGDRYQSQREEALATFRSGLYNILVATAVAARGLDIRGIGYVINYDMPKEIDEYVHRIGRTGRVGNLGRAISFYDATTDFPIAKDLVKILNNAGQVVDDWLNIEAEQIGYAQNYREAGAFASADIRRGAGQVVDYWENIWENIEAEQIGYAPNYRVAGAFASADVRRGAEENANNSKFVEQLSVANAEECSDQETDEQDTESVLASFLQEWKREIYCPRD